MDVNPPPWFPGVTESAGQFLIIQMLRPLVIGPCATQVEHCRGIGLFPPGSRKLKAFLNDVR